MESLTRRIIITKYLAESKEQTFDMVLQTEIKNHQAVNNHHRSMKEPRKKYLRDEYLRRWTKARRTESRFLSQNKNWLDVTLVLDTEDDCFDQDHEKRSRRAENEFDIMQSERTKRRKTEELRKNCSGDQLAYAVQMKLRECGKRDAAKLCKEATLTSPTRPTKILNKVNSESQHKQLSPYHALCLQLNRGMSKATYCLMRSVQKEHNCRLFPPYARVLEAKQSCYPPGMLIDDFNMKLPLQSLLDHTARD
ncbi:uncharacterized protein LOC125041121 [Penaeus chinensis]|uniref:uncharacterized protein LOC125041121 n=1 Tax=Penaeus chinensis TaxID=139456 RepID=UPI001FB634F8|nr:uncharacterized protein LOC125041121 [Penaeus chinensis]